MALEVLSVTTDQTYLSGHNSVEVVVEATDADFVFITLNGILLQLEARGTNIYVNRIHSVRIGVCTDEPIVAWALDSGTGDTHTLTGPNVTVGLETPMMPAEFLVALFQSESAYAYLGKEIVICTENDEKRFDAMNTIGVVIKEGKRVRENTSRHHYKNVGFPLVVQVYHNGSKEECQRLFEALLAVEEANVNLNGDYGYNWLELKDEGKQLPYVNIHSIVHSLALHQVQKKVQIDGY